MAYNKLLKKILGITWPVQSIVPVEILHLSSYESHSVIGERTTNLNYQKFNTVIDRPHDGIETIHVMCQYCEKRININIQSANYTNKILVPILIGSLILLIIAIGTGVVLSLTGDSGFVLIAMITSIVFFGFGLIASGFLVASLYWDQGIGIANTEFVTIGRQQFAKHSINLNIDQDALE